MKQYGLMVGIAMGIWAVAQGLNGLPAAYAGFARWEKVVGQNLPTGGPHAGQAKAVYANPAAAKEWKSGKSLPVGSIVVKTAGSAGAPTLIATMEKRPNGWYYEEYFPEGGKYVLKFGGPNGQQLCVGCHTHFGSIVHFGKPKRYYRNAFLLPSVGLNPSPLTAQGGEGFKRKRYHRGAQNKDFLFTRP